jgi:hypothetical protein
VVGALRIPLHRSTHTDAQPARIRTRHTALHHRQYTLGLCTHRTTLYHTLMYTPKRETLQVKASFGSLSHRQTPHTLTALPAHHAVGGLGLAGVGVGVIGEIQGSVGAGVGVGVIGEMQGSVGAVRGVGVFGEIQGSVGADRGAV